MAIDGYKFSKASGGGSGAMDAKDGADLDDLDLALILDPDSDEARLYLLDEDSGEAADGERIVEPLVNAGTKRWKEKKFAQTNSIPIGTIVAWSGGYFATETNGGFVDVLGNNIAAANSFLNTDGWYVCDGSELNLAGSPIYNGSGRHLPNLVNDRFIMGRGEAGVVGGDNNMDHHHTVDIAPFSTGVTTLSLSQIPAHLHEVPNLKYRWTDVANGNGHGWEYDNVDPITNRETTSVGGGQGHSHSANPPPTDTGGASVFENRPRFLSCFYIQKVI